MSRYCVLLSWDEAPHLSPEAKAELIAAYPPNERDSRTKGIPQLGAGAIYPVPEGDFVIDPIELPAWWRRAYGLDVGWNCTAAVWGAHDLDTDIVYIWSEYYRGQAEPAIHAEAIRSRGAWIPGVIDPASRGRGQADGMQIFAQYTDPEKGRLNLSVADNKVKGEEGGIYAVWTRLSTGRLKVFKTCQNLLREYRIYRRDEKGRIVKEQDHALDACLTTETLVATDGGWLPISFLVGCRGKVLSRDGAWAEFIGARLTIKDALVVRVEFEDGSTVRCTPDHPFLTPDGWQPAIDMPGRSCYNGVSQGIEARRWIFRLRSSLRQFRSFGASAIIGAASISSAMASVFTALSGRRPMAASPQTATMSTMTTRIDPTTNHQTSPSSSDPSIYRDIPEATHVPSLRKLERLLPRGMAVPKASRGIGNITRRIARIFTSRVLASATNVEPNTMPIGEAFTSASAPTPARPGRASYLALTMRNVAAWCATRLSLQIAMCLRGHARANVLVRCRAVSVDGRADVYCLTVPGLSAFCVAGGHVVHNTRYLIMSGIDRAVPVPPEHWAEEHPELVSRKTQHQYNYSPLDQLYDNPPGFM